MFGGKFISVNDLLEDDMRSILFVVPFVVLYICNWGASIGGESDVV